MPYASLLRFPASGRQSEGTAERKELLLVLVEISLFLFFYLPKTKCVSLKNITCFLQIRYILLTSIVLANICCKYRGGPAKYRTNIFVNNALLLANIFTINITCTCAFLSACPFLQSCNFRARKLLVTKLLSKMLLSAAKKR